MKAVQSALTWVAIAAIVLVALPVMAVVRLFDWRKPYRATGRVFRFMGGLIPRINPAWRITKTGELPSVYPFVAVSNHQSNADIPLISMLPWEMKWVAKKALFDVPVLGWEMTLAADIPVDRKNAESRATVLLRAERRLEKGCSVMFFAEGTRSRDGHIKAFRDGAFRLAIEAGVPILPLAVDGTMNALPTDGWTFNAAHCRLHVFEPISTEGLTEDNVPMLRERVRQQIVEKVAAWRNVAPEAVDGLAATQVLASSTDTSGAVENPSKSTSRS
ncbi:MAG: lysophospholipid acyltransferase family protein [Bacteroidota bacterium]